VTLLSLLAIILSLLVLIVLQRITKRLLLAILASIIVLILFRFDLSSLGLSIAEPFTDPAFYKLIITLFLIYFFSHVLTFSGDARSFTQSSQALFDNPTAMAFMPTLIGFLPMPGGAMFTAPMIRTLGETEKKSPDYLLAINYWFRHAVEFFWPVYSAMYLVVSLTGKDLASFSMTLFPVFLAAFISGWFFLNGFRLPRIKKAPLKELKGLWLVGFIIIIGILILGFKIEGYLALLLCIGGYALLRKKHILPAFKGALEKWDVFLLLYMFFVYKSYLIRVGFPASLAADFQAMNLGVGWMTALLPLCLGIATGITQSTVGITTPLLMSMGADATWLYFWAVVGVLISPVHLCVVLTADYFKADMTKLFIRILPMIAISGVVLWIL
jgi:integral membrane protein (TIGR00529 family)